MERLQGHINPYFLDRKPDVRSLEVERFEEASRFVFEEEESLQESIPFLEMLRTEEDYSRFSPIKEPKFLTLLSLKKPWEPFESYLSQEDHKPEFHSPVQSETNRFSHHNSMVGTNQALSNQEPNIPSSSSQWIAYPKRKRKTGHQEPTMIRGEKRKRKRTRAVKKIEEIENQRINHIAVERNRRRQMNEHINSLRSLLPPSYIQRGDQASIVGGAIDYVKVLEQIIQSLESQKKTQQNNQESSSNPLSGISSNNLWVPHGEDQSLIPKIEVNVIQDHVNLKVQCLKKQGQLLKGIVSLEKLRLTVLHLSIASPSHSSVSYYFNLKVEDNCDLESGDQIKAAAHRIFDIPMV